MARAARDKLRGMVAMAPMTKLDSGQPEWVIAMHEHFQRTGYYRAEDLQRVLGDPRESVRISPALDTPMAARIEK
jgi:hypothetical protein